MRLPGLNENDTHRRIQEQRLPAWLRWLLIAAIIAIGIASFFYS